MSTLTIILISVIAVLVFFLSVSVYFNIKHGIIILKFVDSIEETLDILDQRYDSISQVLEIPLFYDSPQVRQVVDDVRICRDSLLKSANILSKVSQEEDEEKTSN